MPFERTMAVNKARKFMEKILHEKDVPSWIKDEASHILKHFPFECDMDFLEKGKEQHMFDNRHP